MPEIRSFLNSDLPHLARLWVAHHAAYRPPPAVSTAVWEQAVAARHFFDPARLSVAADLSGPLAWCQWFDAGDGQAHLAAVCWDPTAAGAAAATALVDHCLQQIAAAGMQRVQAGPHDGARWGYQGLEPVGQGIGISTSDRRTSELLSAAGFEAAEPFDRWEVATANYRPPFSREALAFHRSTRIATRNLAPASPADAAAMFHLDVQRFDLLGTSGNQPLASAEVWLSDPDAQVMSTQQAILGRVAGGSPGQASIGQPSIGQASDEAAIRYLVGQIIGQLASKRIGTLIRSVATSETAETARWQAMKFQKTDSGQTMVRRLQ